MGGEFTSDKKIKPEQLIYTKLKTRPLYVVAQPHHAIGCFKIACRVGFAVAAVAAVAMILCANVDHDNELEHTNKLLILESNNLRGQINVLRQELRQAQKQLAQQDIQQQHHIKQTQQQFNHLNEHLTQLQHQNQQLMQQLREQQQQQRDILERAAQEQHPAASSSSASSQIPPEQADRIAQEQQQAQQQQQQQQQQTFIEFFNQQHLQQQQKHQEKIEKISELVAKQQEQQHQVRDNKFYREHAWARPIDVFAGSGYRRGGKWPRI